MRAAALTKGGRAIRRALQQGLFLALCVAGLALIGNSAVVPAKAVLAQILLDRAFDRSLAAGHGVKPWPWADTAPVARIGVARLGARAVVLSGGSGQAMAFGPTLIPRTGAGVTIMAAHRDTHFAFIQDMKVGDIVQVEPVAGPTRRYRVTGFQTVRWDRFAYPDHPARPVLALTTCWPFDAVARGPWRRVAWAEAIGSGSSRPNN